MKSKVRDGMVTGVDGYCVRYEQMRARSVSWNGIAKWLSDYANSAQRRKLAFELTVRQVKTLLEGPCHYCRSFADIGIDRVQNDIGYLDVNCISACQTCNFMKGQMDYDVFLEQCRKIASCHAVVRSD